MKQSLQFKKKDSETSTSAVIHTTEQSYATPYNVPFLDMYKSSIRCNGIRYIIEDILDFSIMCNETLNY